MKIGILTFHWGTNYGGVLQCYSMQEALKELGYETWVINYAPRTFRDNYFLCYKHRKISDIKSDLFDYQKELKFKVFRKEYLNLTKRFYNVRRLQRFCNNFDAIICGSDQIWNPYSIQTYGVPYLLPFNLENPLKIAYAVSLGCNQYPAEKLKQISDKIQDFNFVSVREKSAIDIINEVRTIKDTVLMPDPVFLLDAKTLLKKLGIISKTNKHIFFYILQNEQIAILSLLRLIEKKEIVINAHSNYNAIDIIEWCSNIANSKYIVTNSFHGIAISILLNKPFVAVPVEGKLEGMNDRIHTILEYFNLTNRILTDCSERGLEDILNQNINWFFVNDKINNLKSRGIDFLERCLSTK